MSWIQLKCEENGKEEKAYISSHNKQTQNQINQFIACFGVYLKLNNVNTHKQHQG